MAGDKCPECHGDGRILIFMNSEFPVMIDCPRRDQHAQEA